MGEEATIAAREVAEIGKTVTGIARDIRNNSIYYQAGLPRSYAAIIARGTLAVSIYNTQNIYTTLAPV